MMKINSHLGLFAKDMRVTPINFVAARSNFGMYTNTHKWNLHQPTLLMFDLEWWYYYDQAIILYYLL